MVFVRIAKPLREASCDDMRCRRGSGVREPTARTPTRAPGARRPAKTSPSTTCRRPWTSPPSTCGPTTGNGAALQFTWFVGSRMSLRRDCEVSPVLCLSRGSLLQSVRAGLYLVVSMQPVYWGHCVNVWVTEVICETCARGPQGLDSNWKDRNPQDAGGGAMFTQAVSGCGLMGVLLQNTPARTLHL